MEIKRGDVFVVRSPGFLPAMIRWAQKLWSKDHSAIYNHGGIVLDNSYKTLEAKARVKYWNLWKYSGRQIAIYRPTQTLEDEFYGVTDITGWDIDRSIKYIEDNHLGQLYPVHRLVLHIFRPLAKFSYHGKYLVCSELVAKYLHSLGARGKHYAGTNPDMLADEWRHWKNMKRIYKGEFPAEGDDR